MLGRLLMLLLLLPLVSTEIDEVLPAPAPVPVPGEPWRPGDVLESPKTGEERMPPKEALRWLRGELGEDIF